MHCLASTGSSLKHSTRVLVLVIAEYFTDTEYTPLQALRQGAAACCFLLGQIFAKLIHIDCTSHQGFYRIFIF